MKRLAIVTVAGLLSFALSAEAQILTGSMIGIVRDESGAVLPGVTVTVTSPAMPAGPVAMATNAHGEYRFAQLQPGTYELTVELAGFRTYMEKDLRVGVGGTVERNVTLGVGAVSETVTVSGEAPLVDPRQTGVAKNLPQEVVDNIPHNRYGLGAFMMMLPGVTTANYNRIGFGGNIMGSNANESSYVVDGVLNNHVQTGGGYSYQDLDGQADINVVTLGASAEYQQAQGGVMNAVSKSGTNKFHGDGAIFWGPDALSSSPIKVSCNCPEGETGFQWYLYRDRSGHIGGPIKKDHLWFFTGETHVGQTFRFPGAPTPLPQYRWEFLEARLNAKATWKVNEKMTFTQVFYYEWWEYTTPQFPTVINPLETIRWYPGDIRDTASELTATLSASTVLTARYVFHYMPYGDTGFGPSYTRYDITTPARQDTFTGAFSGNMFAPADGYLPRRDEVDVKVNQYLSGDRANHNIRMGVQFARNHTIEEFVQPSGVRYLDFKAAPDQAEFIPPYSDAAQYNAQGLWAEDEVNIGHRLTVVPGVRFDRMKAISPEAPVIDPTTLVSHNTHLVNFNTFRETGATIPGLGNMFTWTKVSPRVGVNLKLTNDDKTILRGTVGRYYRPIFLNDFTIVHPGIAPTTLKRFDPATGGYTTLISVTDPKANLAVDPNMDAPYTDQYSIGMDREVARNLGLSVSYVHKESRNQIGWKDIGGVYGTSTVTAPNGQTLTVYPLLNAPSARKFLRTNGPGYFTRYNGLILQLSRRYANRWMANVGYSYSIAEGLQPGGTIAVGGASTGQDPNDLINLTGRLDPNDRPHMLTVAGLYQIPKIDLQISGNLNLVSGLAYAPQILVVLPQGRRSINLDVPGSYRRPNEQWLNFRTTKIMFRRGERRIELTAEARNMLQEKSVGNLITRVFSSPNFGKPSQWAEPRRLLLLMKAFF